MILIWWDEMELWNFMQISVSLLWKSWNEIWFGVLVYESKLDQGKNYYFKVCLLHSFMKYCRPVFLCNRGSDRNSDLLDRKNRSFFFIFSENATPNPIRFFIGGSTFPIIMFFLHLRATWNRNWKPDFFVRKKTNPELNLFRQKNP